MAVPRESFVIWADFFCSENRINRVSDKGFRKLRQAVTYEYHLPKLGKPLE